MVVTRDGRWRWPRSAARRPGGLRAMLEAWRRPSAGSAETAYREQLHVIVWLLEDGRPEEASRVACEGPWAPGGGRGRPRR
ncbi:hypothetical protein Q7689_30610 [Nocardiopsis tropica]|nr:hypothetical protein [Nocardiopsis tropica]